MTSEEILAIFFVECEESLAAAEAGLVVYKAGTQNDDTINAVFRGVHSIKGGAGAFGFSTLQAYILRFCRGAKNRLACRVVMDSDRLHDPQWLPDA